MCLFIISGKHRGAHSYLQKAFQALAASDDRGSEPSPFRGVDILLHTGFVAAKVSAHSTSQLLLSVLVCAGV